MVLSTFPVSDICCAYATVVETRAYVQSEQARLLSHPNHELGEEGERQESCDSTKDVVKAVICMLTPLRLAWDAWYQKRT